MADEDKDSKTEQPTGKRLGEARSRGQLPTSREVSTWVILLGMLMAVKWLAPPMAAQLISSLRVFIEMPHAIAIDELSMQNMVFQTVIQVAGATAVIFIVMAIAAIVGHVGQTGPFITFETIKPDIAKLSPMNGLRRLISVTALVEFGKSFVKLVVLGSAAMLVLLPALDDLPGFSDWPLMQVMAYMHDKAVHLIIIILLIFTGVALIDLFYQRYAYMKNLRMTKTEVKDERKEQEGDPAVKARLRSIRLERARKRMMAQVPKADVIITNPTHYAIALQYDNKKNTAPVVIAKGVDFLAQRIREIAEENRVPQVSNPPLARTLYDTVEIDKEIPTQHYRAVAEIISYVYKLKKRKF